MGVPILNRPELLDALIDSIDAPIERKIVVDNGKLFDLSAGSGVVEVIQPGHNLGVGASWNLVMKATPLAPWWLFVNNDIEFGTGDLAKLQTTVDPYFAAIYHMLGFAAFAITAPALTAVGYFDENFHPAYDEDLDMSRRCELAGVPRIDVGFTGTHVGSATIYADPLLRFLNGKSHTANDAYYARKWGGPKQGGEVFTTPFNQGGHVGDWRLDPERLRNQAW
jgi:GT2 family glycosyltransferase